MPVQIDMDMPDCCLACPIAHPTGKQLYCCISAKVVGAGEGYPPRPKWCILREVKQ